MLTSYLLHILKQILTSTSANNVEDTQSNKDAGDMEKISITKTTNGIKKTTEGIVYYMYRNKLVVLRMQLIFTQLLMIWKMVLILGLLLVIRPL